MQGPASFNNVIANTVVVTGANGGVFVYKSGTTPALGNPPIAWTSNGGLLDPYGNVLPAVSGIAGTGFFEATDGTNVTTIAPGSISNTGTHGSLDFSNGQFDLGTNIFMSAQGTGQLTVGSGTPNTAACQWLLPFNTFLVMRHPGTVSTPEGWNNIALLAGFAAGGQTPQYKLMTDNTVMLRGAVNLTANQAAGTAFGAAASGYVPATSQFFNTGNNLSGYALGNNAVKIESGGAYRINVAGTAGNTVQLDGIRYAVD